MELRNAFLFFCVFVSTIAGCRAMPVSQEIDDGNMVVDKPMPEKPHETPSKGEPSRMAHPVRWDVTQPPPDTDEGPVEYASEVRLNAACDMDPASIVVVQGRAEPALCEHMIAISIFEDNGDTYDIWRSYDWSDDSWSDIGIECMNGPHDDFCWAVGHRDIFDSWDGTEPTAFIMVCANNDCTGAAPECEPIVCTSIVAISVVNLEGTWTSIWASEPDGESFTFAQDARTFEDAVANTKNGFVDGTHVSFDKGDYHFEGDLSSDRATITGDVTDLIFDSPVGSWTMVRTSP